MYCTLESSRALQYTRLLPRVIAVSKANFMLMNSVAAAVLAAPLMTVAPSEVALRQAFPSEVALRQAFSFVAQAFPLSAVTLANGSRLKAQSDANTKWLLSLDPTRLCCLHTSAANLTCSTTGTPYKCTPSASQPACTPYPHVAYFGHFVGHYLSAMAMAYESTGSAAVKATADAVVSRLSLVQHAFGAHANETGLIHPFDVRSFQRLYDTQANCQPVCVPFYVLHKMLAGLLEQTTRAASQQAHDMAVALGDWVAQSVEGVIARAGLSGWQRVLGIEWGGMNEAMCVSRLPSRSRPRCLRPLISWLPSNKSSALD